MSVTTVSAGPGGITVNGTTYSIDQWMAMGGAAGLGVGGASAAQSQAQVDGRALLQNFLTQYGLSGININDAWSQYVASGSNIDYWANTWLPTTKAFQAAYPAYQQLMQEGRGITVADYRNYQLSVRAEAHAAGFPDGTITQDTITNWLLGDVSAAEAQQRIQGASAAVNQLDKNSQEYLQAKELGLTDGDLAAVWFDPKTAVPLLETKLAAAQIGGAAAGAGIDLQSNLAEDLAKRGVTQQQALQGFGDIANQQQLYKPLPGQQGAALDQNAQVGAEFGTSPQAAQLLKQRAAQRTAAFQGSTQYTSTNQGLVGAGANRSV